MEICPCFENIPGKVAFDEEKQRAFWSEYWFIYSRLKTLPDYNRVPAEKRFLLIKGFEEYFVKKEAEALGSMFRRKKAMGKYCELNNISLSSFYRWLRHYKLKGIEGIIPGYVIQPDHKETVFRREKSRNKRNDKPIKIEIEVDNKSPVLFLDRAREFSRIHIEIQPEQQRSYIKLLDTVLAFSKRKYHTPLNLLLSDEDINTLEKYKKRMHKNHQAKATALLMINRGHTIFEAALESRRSCGSIYRWLRRLRKNGVSFIETKMVPDKKKQMWEERITRVINILHAPPGTYNINRTSWIYDAIIQVYQEIYHEHLPKGALQRIIKSTKYTWRHARKVLTSKDPDYKKKAANVFEALRNTKDNEAFFFIDEAGPYKVKKYGGKALMPVGITRTIPQHQETKGEVQYIAALEAFTNQLTWLFIEYKDAESIIAMLEVLRLEYASKAKICLTWDSISAHRSRAVRGWIAQANKNAKAQEGGPIFKVVPLPSNAQFLNVIEAVYGGIKKAVIHNSDYGSKEEMQAAIARHCEERNTYFQENPKRVGNKIWDKGAFEIEELPGGLFKKM